MQKDASDPKTFLKHYARFAFVSLEVRHAVGFIAEVEKIFCFVLSFSRPYQFFVLVCICVPTCIILASMELTL